MEMRLHCGTHAGVGAWGWEGIWPHLPFSLRCGDRAGVSAWGWRGIPHLPLNLTPKNRMMNRGWP
eukprot:13600060-Alexandrium_andersonii.AAC.1